MVFHDGNAATDRTSQPRPTPLRIGGGRVRVTQTCIIVFLLPLPERDGRIRVTQTCTTVLCSSYHYQKEMEGRSWLLSLSGKYGGLETIAWEMANMTLIDLVEPEVTHKVPKHWHSFPPPHPLWHPILGTLYVIIRVGDLTPTLPATTHYPEQCLCVAGVGELTPTLSVTKQCILSSAGVWQV
ncbi:hypothetical protein Pcinc_024225 [Petrolisthes cinctipes]|uniref:Uncharacterized protein n=1 Tax=Petrolisthes cinctipes TaxID=88211 RepID=A0AAE1KB37_PETCI|nr:hypothetical protein Pcinc_024225 [Petrolisthes cinctipes]